MRRRVVLGFALIVAASPVTACRRGDSSPAATTALQQVLAGLPIASAPAALWKDVHQFYSQRGAAPAWVDGRTPAAEEARQVLRTAFEHGFAPADYGEPQIAAALTALNQPSEDEDSLRRVQQIAELDVRITTALLALGRDVALGRTKPESIDFRWKARRETPDLTGTLVHATGGTLKTWLDTIRPRHPTYATLQRALIALQGQRDKGGWPEVAAVARLKAGRSDPAVAALRARLAAGGHLTGAAAVDWSPSYDREVAAGVRAFQELHGLRGTGVADAATIAAMNVSIDARIRQVVLNLERWRWLPDDLGGRHLLVNIPSYHLIARENGRAVMDIRVVVGEVDKQTPVFSDEMTTVVFSPYWNIPDSIVTGETAPAVARDSGYLARNDIEVLRVSKSGATPVDPSSVEWDDPDKLKQLAFRQRPGPRNALGHVKFLFPNEFDVYLHDTPADSLFARPGRALSHGCIRVEEPEALAKYVLRGYSGWDDRRILEAMRSGTEQQFELKEKIPVHIVYFTAWVDEQGGLHFRHDVYGHDARQAEQLEGKGRRSS